MATKKQMVEVIKSVSPYAVYNRNKEQLTKLYDLALKIKEQNRTKTTEINLSKVGAEMLIQKLGKVNGNFLGYVDVQMLQQIVADYSRLAKATREAQ